nr:MAG TPA: hypothetical protein [Caudoviricetes sp.]
MSRARATPLHRTAAAHTTAIPHTDVDGHHPLIHTIYSHSFMFTQPTINVDQ